MTEPWCVLLASRAAAQKDPLSAALCRASRIASRKTTAAVIAARADSLRQTLSQHLDAENLVIQPRHQGTGYEVLLALLQLESRVPKSTPILFFPVDCVVRNEDVMTRTLETLVDWISRESNRVYLLGAVPLGPNERLGYIVPWHDAIHMPTSIYEFVERPNVREAGRLIRLGALWNTFIFGGTLPSLISLFRPQFDSTITALRSRPHDMESIALTYESLTPVDFSQSVLAKRTEYLHVLRLPPCGWWPLTADERDGCLRCTEQQPMTQEPNRAFT